MSLGGVRELAEVAEVCQFPPANLAGSPACQARTGRGGEGGGGEMGATRTCPTFASVQHTFCVQALRFKRPAAPVPRCRGSWIKGYQLDLALRMHLRGKVNDYASDDL